MKLTERKYNVHYLQKAKREYPEMKSACLGISTRMGRRGINGKDQSI